MENEIRNSTPASDVPRSDPDGTGYLILHVTTAGGAIPLEGVKISVNRYDPEVSSEPQSRGDTIASPVSDRDGNTVRIPLSAPPKRLSESPGNSVPFSLYSVDAVLDGYYSQSYAGIPIFDGVTSVQPIVMIPLPENGTQGLPRPDSIRYFEGINPNL